jgi:HTH-type transcriptional regulator/antitoxin HipB
MEQTIRTSKQLGAAIRRYRKQSRLSQAELGSQIRKRQATVSTLESDGAGTLATLFAVLSALDLEIVVRSRTKSTTLQLSDLF